MVLEMLNYSTVQHTPNLSSNGLNLTDSNTSTEEFVPLSPIARPAINVTPDDLELDDDEILAERFARIPINRIDDTEISIHADQNEIFREIGLPERWLSKELEVKVYVDDLNVIEKACQEGVL